MISFVNRLSQFSNSDGEQILSALALRLSPNPGRTRHVPDEPSEEELDRLTHQIRQHLGLAVEDTSEDAQQKIFSFIADELLSSTLEGRESQVKQRLADKRILPMEQYSVTFSDAFRQCQRGVSEKHACETVKHPDLLEHTIDDYFLCVKHYGAPSSGNRYSLLVEGRREQATLVVHRAWRIYHREIPCENVQRPLDLLRMFADAYGLPFDIAGKGPVKFLAEEAVHCERPIHSASDVFQFLSVQNPNEHDWEASGFFRVSELNVIRFAFFCVIDVSRYQNDLRQHGVNLRP